MIKKSHNLIPGDCFTYWVYDATGQMGVKVEILKPSQPHTDMFGRPMLKFWAKRHDTNQEAWMVLGPDADIEVGEK